MRSAISDTDLTTFQTCVQGEQHEGLVEATTLNFTNRGYTQVPIVLVNGVKLKTLTVDGLNKAVADRGDQGRRSRRRKAAEPQATVDRLGGQRRRPASGQRRPSTVGAGVVVGRSASTSAAGRRRLRLDRVSPDARAAVTHMTNEGRPAHVREPALVWLLSGGLLVGSFLERAAGRELDRVRSRDRDHLAGRWVAAFTGGAVADRKSEEARHADLVSLGDGAFEGGLQCTQDGVHGLLLQRRLVGYGGHQFLAVHEISLDRWCVPGSSMVPAQESPVFWGLQSRVAG